MKRASAAELVTRYLKLSDGEASTPNVTYEARFTIPALSTVGSIRLQTCSNTSLVDDACTAPFGFDALSANLVSQAGTAGFSISVADSTANEIVLTRPPVLQPAGTVTLTFDGITNPASLGSYYARIYTYASSNGSGAYTDAGGLAFSIQRSFAIGTEVPPYITFCIGESITAFDCDSATEPFSDLGILTPSITSAAQSQIVVATNAANGYSMWAMGTPLTSGANVLSAMSGGPATPGTSQFGLNLRDNSAPNVGQDPQGPGAAGVTANYNTPNSYRFQSGDTLASAATADDYRKYTVSYIVNIPSNQPGGVYSTTLLYVCLANF